MRQVKTDARFESNGQKLVNKHGLGKKKIGCCPVIINLKQWNSGFQALYLVLRKFLHTILPVKAASDVWLISNSAILKLITFPNRLWSQFTHKLIQSISKLQSFK